MQYCEHIDKNGRELFEAGISDWYKQYVRNIVCAKCPGVAKVRVTNNNFTNQFQNDSLKNVS